jgi:hypothetical protein
MSQFNCARARSLVSLQLDDELSELEDALLDAHLAACSACREFKLSAEDFTVALRGAPLDPFQVVVVMPRRGQARRHATRLVVGAAAAVAVVSISGVIDTSNSPRAVPPSHASLVRFGSENIEEGRAKRANLLAQVDRSWVPRGGKRSLLL